MNGRRIPFPLRVSLFYALVGGLWILLSDQLVAFFFVTPEYLSKAQTFKGWFFIATTAVLLFALLAQEVRSRRKTEQRYTDLFLTAVEGVFQSTPDGRFMNVNPALARMFGYSSPNEMLAMVKDIPSRVYLFREDRSQFAKILNEQGVIENFESQALRKDGSTFWVSINAHLVLADNGRAFYEGFITDVTQQKNSEIALKEAEARYRSLVEQMPAAVYTDAPTTENSNYYSSPQILTITGYSPQEWMADPKLWIKLIHPEDGPRVLAENERTNQTREAFDMEYRIRTREGRVVWVHDMARLICDEAGIPLYWQGTFLDITEQKKVEEALQKQLKELTVLHAAAIAESTSKNSDELLQRVTDIIGDTLFLDNCGVLLLVDEGTNLQPHHSYRGITRENIPSTLPLTTGISGKVVATKRPIRVGNVDEEPNYYEVAENTRSEVCVPIMSGEKVLGVLNVESKQLDAFTESDERLLNTIAGGLATALERLRFFELEKARRMEAERLREATSLLTSSLELPHLYETILDAAGQLVSFDSASISLELSGALELVAGRGLPESLPYIGKRHHNEMKWEIFAASRRPLLLADAQASEFFEKWEGTEYSGSWIGIPLVAHDKFIGVLSLNSSTPGTFTEEQGTLLQTFANHAAIAIENGRLFETQLRRRQAADVLREATATLTASVEIEDVYNTILKTLFRLAPCDSASIELIDGEDVEIVAQEGLPQGNQLLGTRYPFEPGKWKIDIWETILIPDVQSNDRFKEIAGSEHIRGWLGVPMISHERLIGYLNLNSDRIEAFTEEHSSLVRTFANQAAIAIDNTRLFENLQRSNQELRLAYDTTLEGWSKALELRDKETQGHTRRVTDLTLELARQMHIPDAQLTQIRRGVLVHDIGKMGVPDNILRKNGPLTEEEWVEMRKHPQYAFDLLHPIHYLRPALDIAYCHHEWWDGSGYPAGLKGHNIPLAARIFAVVDVWDALLSDRPYRAPWTKRKVIEYIRGLSGKQFDPEVVKVFLKMMEEKTQPRKNKTMR